MGRYQVRKDTGTQVPTYFGQDSIGQRRCGNWGGLCRRAIPPRYECRGFPRKWMNYGETAYARPIGITSTEPREEYKPKMTYRRGEEYPFPKQVAVSKPEQKDIVDKPEIAAPKPEQRDIIEKPETAPTKANIDKPSGSPYAEGAYTDRIIAAVRDGHQITTDIVSVTGIPRKAVVKAIGRLVIQGKLRNLPAPAGLPKGDRCVALCDKPLVMDKSLSPVTKLQLLMNEQVRIQASFAAIHEQLEALKKKK